jgi:hypothetical protein
VRRQADLKARPQDPDGSSPDPPTSESEDSNSYAVGYRQPPRHTQFKPGRSGNPRGRPKTPTAFDELIEKELAQLVIVREGDQARQLTKRRVIVKQVVKKAMEGEDRALRSLLTLLSSAKAEKQRSNTTGDVDDGSGPLTETEKAILSEHEAQLREKIAQEQAAAADPIKPTGTKHSKEDDR